MTDGFLTWLESERAKIRQGLEWLQTGKMDIGNMSGGHFESERDNLIEHYRRVLRELDRLIADRQRGT